MRSSFHITPCFQISFGICGFVYAGVYGFYLLIFLIVGERLKARDIAPFIAALVHLIYANIVIIYAALYIKKRQGQNLDDNRDNMSENYRQLH